MPYLVTCIYLPDAATTRLGIRDLHIRYILDNLAKIDYAGALSSEDGKESIGMFVALKTDSIEQARQFLAQEPYTLAQLFGSVNFARLHCFIPHDDPHFLLDELKRERTRLAKEKTLGT